MFPPSSNFNTSKTNIYFKVQLELNKWVQMRHTLVSSLYYHENEIRV